MLSEHTATSLDRAVFARRHPSRLEAIIFNLRELKVRAQARSSRSRCEARMSSLAPMSLLRTGRTASFALN